MRVIFSNVSFAIAAMSKSVIAIRTGIRFFSGMCSDVTDHICALFCSNRTDWTTKTFRPEDYRFEFLKDKMKRTFETDSSQVLTFDLFLNIGLRNSNMSQ